MRDYWERIERNTRDRSEADINDLGDTEHYRDGIEAATQGSPADRIDWIAQHEERQRNALLHAICVLDGCNPHSALPTVTQGISNETINVLAIATHSILKKSA